MLVVNPLVDALSQLLHPATVRLLSLTQFNSPALALKLSNHQAADVLNNTNNNSACQLARALVNKAVFPNNSQPLSAKTRVRPPANQLVLNQFNSSNQLNNNANKTAKQLAHNNHNNNHNASNNARLLANLMISTTSSCFNK